MLVLKLPTTAPALAASSLSIPLVRVAFLFLSLPDFFLFLSNLLPTAALLFRFSVPNLFPVMLCFLYPLNFFLSPFGLLWTLGISVCSGSFSRFGSFLYYNSALL